MVGGQAGGNSRGAVGVTVMDKSAGTAVPPLSLMTCLITVSLAVWLTAVHRTAGRGHGDATVEAVGEARDDVAVGVDLDAEPADRRVGDRYGVRRLPVARRAESPPDSANVYRAPGVTSALTPVVPVGPAVAPAGAMALSVQALGSGRAAVDALDEGQAGGAGDRVGHHEGVRAGGQRGGVRERQVRPRCRRATSVGVRAAAAQAVGHGLVDRDRVALGETGRC